MKAIRLTGVNRLEVVELESEHPGPGDVIVRTMAASLNHRDLWIKGGNYAGLRYPVTPGSDGAGTVIRAGEGAEQWLGREVIINPGLAWGDSPLAQGPGFSILGLPKDGTFAEEVLVPASQLAEKPDHMDWAEAAGLPLAGLTAWRALFARGNLKAGERVLVTGAGGGVATFAVQFAHAAGAEVWVSSGSEEKIGKAMVLGATGGFNYRQADWGLRAADTVKGLFDLVVDGAAGPGFETLLDLAAPGGRIVMYGVTCGAPPLFPTRKVFWKQLTLCGSTMGSPSDFAAMVRLVNGSGLRPVISRELEMRRAEEAFALMEAGDQFGKIVLRPEW